MKPASRLFFLSVFALWTPLSVCEQQSACVISPKTIVDDACVSYATLDQLNQKIKPSVNELTQTTDFFSYYRLNLFNKVCPFWDDSNGMCGNIACAVDTVDKEEDIPLVWRASELSKLEGPMAKHPGKKRARTEGKPLDGMLGASIGEGCVVEYDDEDDAEARDYCVLEDETLSSAGDYVSLLSNPERFTGYSGDGARQVWDAIYRENCFQRSSFPHAANLGSLKEVPGPAAQDFKHVLDAAGRTQQLEKSRLSHPNMPFVANTGYEVEDECLEKRVFYRVVSGMHASISTHLCWNFLNQTTGEWQPNVQCYVSRLHEYPDRLSNLYFNYALVTRAIAKLGPYLRDTYTFCSGDATEDAATRAKVLEVTQEAASVPHIFDESLMFVNGEGPSLKEDFRSRFRNVSRLMDCVGCDKCRLWGKLQTNGYGTALKVLFESDNHGHVPALKRTELVALFNTYARLTESISAIGNFKAMLNEEQDEEWNEATQQVAEEGAAARRQGTDTDDMDPQLLAFFRLRKRGPKAPGAVAEFWFQLELLGSALHLVFSQWLAVPVNLWIVAKHEARRLLNFWIGLPVPPRQWTFGIPKINHEEL